MAKQASSKGARKSDTAPKAPKQTGAKSAPRSTAVARTNAREENDGGSSTSGREALGDALMKLLQSPLVAELLTVAATAALAALAEHGFSGGQASRGKRAGSAVKEAGKAAATAVGRRLKNEFEEIREAAMNANSAEA